MPSVLRSDLRIHDAQGDPTAERGIILIAEDEARESATRIREQVAAARAQRPGGIAGVGQGGVSVLTSMGYMGKDEDSGEDDPGSEKDK